MPRVGFDGIKFVVDHLDAFHNGPLRLQTP